MIRQVFAFTLSAVLAGTAMAGENDVAVSKDSVRSSMEQAIEQDRACIVSHRMETTSNVPADMRAEVATGTDAYEFRRGGCPTEEKRNASVAPPGR